MEKKGTSANNGDPLKPYLIWWNHLTPDWKKAYNETLLRRSSIEALPAEALLQIHFSPALRFAGPSAPFPNMSFELKDLTGIAGLENLEILVVTHHQLLDIRLLSTLPKLKSIFVNNNQITSLEGIETLSHLQEVYFNVNRVDSLKLLEKHTNIHTLYCNYNQIASLEGIGQQHTQAMRNFICLPNDNLSDAECIRFENTVGIRCRKG